MWNNLRNKVFPSKQSKRNKDYTFTVRLTETDKKIIEGLASELDHTKSFVVRRIIKDFIETHNLSVGDDSDAEPSINL